MCKSKLHVGPFAVKMAVDKGGAVCYNGDKIKRGVYL